MLVPYWLKVRHHSHHGVGALTRCASIAHALQLRRVVSILGECNARRRARSTKHAPTSSTVMPAVKPVKWAGNALIGIACFGVIIILPVWSRTPLCQCTPHARPQALTVGAFLRLFFLQSARRDPSFGLHRRRGIDVWRVSPHHCWQSRSRGNERRNSSMRWKYSKRSLRIISCLLLRRKRRS